MAHSTPLQIAQRKRDLGLAKLRQITVWVAVGGVGATLGLSYLAAITPLGQNSVNASSGVGSNQVNANQSGNNNGVGLVVPAQLPQAGFGGIGVSVTGGSLGHLR